MSSRILIRGQAGLSMIEILVSLTIVAFGLLGLLGLQARALSFQKDSFDRRTAAEMVVQLAERLRANHLGFNSGAYDFDLDATDATPTSIAVCTTPTACTLNEVATRDLNQWAAEFRRRLPSSAAYLQWNAADPRQMLVSLAWAEPQQAAADPLCTAIAARLGVAIPVNYRCYETAVFP